MQSIVLFEILFSQKKDEVSKLIQSSVLLFTCTKKKLHCTGMIFYETIVMHFPLVHITTVSCFCTVTFMQFPTSVITKTIYCVWFIYFFNRISLL